MLVVKNLTENAEDLRCEFDPWVGKIPWRRAWQPASLILPGESQWQKSLVGYSPKGCKDQTQLKWLFTHVQKLECPKPNSTWPFSHVKWELILSISVPWSLGGKQVNNINPTTKCTFLYFEENVEPAATGDLKIGQQRNFIYTKTQGNRVRLRADERNLWTCLPTFPSSAVIPDSHPWQLTLLHRTEVLPWVTRTG